MITVQIDSGICGFSTTVRASKLESRSVGIALDSDCKHIKSFGNELKELGMIDILRVPINLNPVYETAGKCRLHSSCPVPCVVIKAAEVALGLALKRDVQIVFQAERQAVGGEG
ncbi:MAG: hypothetical protein GTO12_09635 [Proteobacteria bacterium]|nr:hypothetical protein [Pseudomonadota bacterium]